VKGQVPIGFPGYRPMGVAVGPTVHPVSDSDDEGSVVTPLGGFGEVSGLRLEIVRAERSLTVRTPAGC